MKNILSIGIVCAAAVCSSLIGFGTQDEDKTKKSDQKMEKKVEPRFEDKFEPVDSMHHFMEYICEPSYKVLRKELAEEPKERRAWRGMKSHMLIIAETSSLVSQRVPEKLDKEQAKQWKEIAFSVYESSKELYEAVGDYKKAKPAYESMIQNCNECHKVFVNGKHQLKLYEAKK